MRHILLIGMGPGHPDQITLQAIEAMRSANVFFIPAKGEEKAELAKTRLAMLERHLGGRPFRAVGYAMPERNEAIADYGERVSAWHAAIGGIFSRLFREELGEDGRGAFLVWGDPSLYDSTIRILDAVRAAGEVAFTHEVIPGVTSVQALAAAHGIALNTIGNPVHITTARRLKEGFPDNADSVVVMLDSGTAFAELGLDDLDIFWGAYLGTEDEILVSGTLEDVSSDIQRIRAEARAKKGWMFDTYLLRRR
ncbi:MAG: precorrin-6A synthase (deacetylating) [Rhizobiaceae bacterium]